MDHHHLPGHNRGATILLERIQQQQRQRRDSSGLFITNSKATPSIATASSLSTPSSFSAARSSSAPSNDQHQQALHTLLGSTSYYGASSSYTSSSFKTCVSELVGRDPAVPVAAFHGSLPTKTECPPLYSINSNSSSMAAGRDPSYRLSGALRPPLFKQSSDNTATTNKKPTPAPTHPPPVHLRQKSATSVRSDKGGSSSRDSYEVALSMTMSARSRPSQQTVKVGVVQLMADVDLKSAGGAGIRHVGSRPPSLSSSSNNNRSQLLAPPSSSSSGPQQQQRQLISASSDSYTYSCPGRISKADLVPYSSNEPIIDGVHFAYLQNNPSTLVVRRDSNERINVSERLNLDRRQLKSCPILENESRLRLLNLQNNLIPEIKNLYNLPNLIFLDLYNNCIEEISEAISCVTSLRVLMLGKNRIRAVKNMQHLTKLDVLDLHSNMITKLENLDALTELRVLNMASNQIIVVEGLSSLKSLTELNLRRNQIEKVIELHPLPVLQRVFLSSNRIGDFAMIQSLFDVKYLVELSLDGNSISAPETAEVYRRYIVNRVRDLRQLDGRRINDDERRHATLESKKEDAARRISEAQARLEFDRKNAIHAAELVWEERQKSRQSLQSRPSTALASSRDYSLEQQQDNLNILVTKEIPGSSSFFRGDTSTNSIIRGGNGGETEIFLRDLQWVKPRGGAAAVLATTAQRGNGGGPSSSQGGSSLRGGTADSSSSSSELLKTGYYEVEAINHSKEGGKAGNSSGKATGGGRTLQVYGECWEWLETPNKNKSVMNITELHVKFLAVELIAERASAIVQKLDTLRKLKLAHNNVNSLDQLKSLGPLLSKMSELEIEENSICRLSILRSNVAFMWPNIVWLNGLEMTTEDRMKGKRLFGRLVVTAAGEGGGGKVESATTSRASVVERPSSRGGGDIRQTPRPGTSSTSASDISRSRSEAPPPSSTDQSSQALSCSSTVNGLTSAIERGCKEKAFQVEAKRLAEAEIEKAVKGVDDRQNADQEFERLWNVCINRFIHDTLIKIENEQSYMARCLHDDLH